MKSVRSNIIVGEMIKWATKYDDPILKDLWYLSDYIGGLDRDQAKIVKILDGFDQDKESVIKIREDLKL